MDRPQTILPATPKSPGHIGIKQAEYSEEKPNDKALFQLAINEKAPSTTWSISDITSEGSTRSSLSRGTSKLDIIEEEPYEEIILSSSITTETAAEAKLFSPNGSELVDYGPPQRTLSHGEQSGKTDRIETFDAVGSAPAMMSVMDMSLSLEERADLSETITTLEAERMLDELLVAMEHGSEELDKHLATESTLSDEANVSGDNGDCVLNQGVAQEEVTVSCDDTKTSEGEAEEPDNSDEKSAEPGSSMALRADDPDASSNSGVANVGAQGRSTEDDASVDSDAKDPDTPDDSSEDENQSKTVESFEEPFSPVSEASYDDNSSLDLSSYTTDSEVSVEGWLARFLYELRMAEKIRRIEI